MRRSGSTRSRIGRWCMRGLPISRYSPPDIASAAVSGRNAVPALPRNRSIFLHGMPPAPLTTMLAKSRTSMTMSSFCSAPSITRVSSASSTPFSRVAPLASAESSSTRLEMLFEPGSRSVPLTRAIGGRSRWLT